jgi:hypothetical protein
VGRNEKKKLSRCRVTEIVVRDLCSDVLAFHVSDTAFPHDVMERPDLLKRAVGCFARIVDSAKHDGWPMKGWEDSRSISSLCRSA